MIKRCQGSAEVEMIIILPAALLLVWILTDLSMLLQQQHKAKQISQDLANLLAAPVSESLTEVRMNSLIPNWKNLANRLWNQSSDVALSITLFQGESAKNWKSDDCILADAQRSIETLLEQIRGGAEYDSQIWMVTLCVAAKPILSQTLLSHFELSEIKASSIAVSRYGFVYAE